MRDLKTMYTELLDYCQTDNVLDTEKFEEYLKAMPPEERKALLTDVFHGMGIIVGKVFTKAATVVGDLLSTPYETNNSVHVINLTQLFESSREDYANPLVFEDALKNTLSQVFVKHQWPINAAPFNEVFGVITDGRLRNLSSIGTNLLILGGYDDVINAKWKDPSLGAIIKDVTDIMGYSHDTFYPGWLVVHSGQKDLTGELEQPEIKE